MNNTTSAAAAALALFLAPGAFAQLGLFSKERGSRSRPSWTGERFPDGRPKVPDSILERMRSVTAEEAWGVLTEAGYKLQFEGGWKEINAGAPGRRLVGRVVTAVFVPLRPDLNDAVNKAALAEGRVGRGQNSWVIDTLQPGDVLVVDLFGKIDKGTFIGDNLGTSIFAKTGTGVVVNGSVRDVSGPPGDQGLPRLRARLPSDGARRRDAGGHQRADPHRRRHRPARRRRAQRPRGTDVHPAAARARRSSASSEDVRLRDDWGHEMLRRGPVHAGAGRRQVDARDGGGVPEAWAATRRPKPEPRPDQLPRPGTRARATWPAPASA